MNNVIFFLIPVLLIIPLGIIPAYADIKVTDLGFTEDNRQKFKIQNHYDKILHNGMLKDFIYTNGDNTRTVESQHGSIILNKNTCSFSFYDGGLIVDEKLSEDSIVVLSSVLNSGVWNYVNQVNNAACETYWTGSELVAKKFVTGLGFTEYKYILTDNGWKTQLEATNLTVLTDRVFGFDQTININTDIVTFAGVQRNLDNFDGVTFDRTWIINNEFDIVDFMNGVVFDIDIGIDYLDGITITDTGPNSSSITFHFRTDIPLLPNETIIIDPVYNSTAGGSFSSLRTGSSTRLGEYSNSASSVLNGIQVDDMTWYLKKSGSPTGTIYTRVYNDAGTLQHTFTTTLSAATLTTSPVGYTFTSTGYEFQEGDRIVLEFSGGSVGNVVQVEYSATGTFDGTNSIMTEWNGAWTDTPAYDAYDTKWDMTYSTPAPNPDAVDDLISTGQTYGSVDISWTQPNLNTGNLSGYQINYSTPWTSNPNTIITNNTESSSTSSTISGLSIATQYSIRIGVWTEGFNATGNVLNVTTQGNFTIGSASFNQTNTQVLPITFEEQSINSTAKFLNVTYANTFTLNCDFHYKFANTNQTYKGLTGTAVSSTLDETSFIFNDFENEIIDVYCVDQVTGTDADYLLIQNDFPLLQQIASFRAGDYGTDGKIGVFDFITLAVIIFSMIGLNRVNESVGAVFNIALLGALAYFEIIELPTIIFGIIAVVLVFAITSTRKT